MVHKKLFVAGYQDASCEEQFFELSAYTYDQAEFLANEQIGSGGMLLYLECVVRQPGYHP